MYTLLPDHYLQLVFHDAQIDQVIVTCFDETNKALARQTLFG